MKLNEVAAPQFLKCGLIANLLGEHSLDRDGFEGIGIFTSKAAFIAELKSEYLDTFGGDPDDPDDQGGMDDEQRTKLKNAKTMEDLKGLEAWEEFLEYVWVDDRF